MQRPAQLNDAFGKSMGKRYSFKTMRLTDLEKIGYMGWEADCTLGITLRKGLLQTWSPIAARTQSKSQRCIAN